jgi:hypothetical protein
MAKAVDLKAAKERKQKKIVAVGGVLLVIVLFIQVPRTLKMMNGDAEPAVAAAPSAPSPAPVGTTTPAPVGSEPSPAPAEGVVTATLVSFSRFASKDPFVQQVKEKQGAGSGGSAAVDPPTDTSQPGEGAIGGSEPDGETTAPPEPAAKTTAEIDVNGVLETASVGTAFPAAAPMFLLAKVSAKSVAIKVADGGSFASGDPALKLTLGKAVTLVNTADGTRFVLLLKAVR